MKTIITQSDIEGGHELLLAKAKLLFQHHPFVTKLYMNGYGFPMTWLHEHWEEITGGK